MPALKNPRHEAFAQLRAKGKTADEAYVEAGYKPNRHNASRLNTNETVRSRIEELLRRSANRAEIDVARILKELGRLATSDIREAFDEDGNLKPPAQWSDDLAAAVSSIEVVSRPLPGEADDELDGQPHGGALARRRNPKVEHVHKLRFWDKNSALEKLAKAFGMFVDKMEVSGPEGGPVQTETTINIVPVPRGAFVPAPENPYKAKPEEDG